MANPRPQLDLAASGRFSGAVQIRDVRLSSCYFSAEDLSVDTDGFHTEYFADVKALTSDSITVAVGFRLADHRSGHEAPEPLPDEVVELAAFADYEVTYDIAGTVDPDDAQSFAWINGVMNAWSYWRTLTHSMLMGMGLRAVIVPVFRVENEAIGRPPAPTPRVIEGAVAKTTAPRKAAKKAPAKKVLSPAPTRKAPRKRT